MAGSCYDILICEGTKKFLFSELNKFEKVDLFKKDGAKKWTVSTIRTKQ